MFDLFFPARSSGRHWTTLLCQPLFLCSPPSAVTGCKGCVDSIVSVWLFRVCLFCFRPLEIVRLRPFLIDRFAAFFCLVCARPGEAQGGPGRPREAQRNLGEYPPGLRSYRHNFVNGLALANSTTNTTQILALGMHHQSHGRCRLCRIMLCPMTSLYMSQCLDTQASLTTSSSSVP